MNTFPPNTPPPANNFHTFGSVDVDGVTLDMRYNSGASTHVMVGAFGSLSRGKSWLGWACTDRPVPEDRIKETAHNLGRVLLAETNSEVLCTDAFEALRREAFEARDKADDCRRNDNARGAAYWDGIHSGACNALPLLAVLADRIGVGFADKAHEPQRKRIAAELANAKPMTHAEETAALVGAIRDGVGDRADISLMVVGKDGVMVSEIQSADRLIDGPATRAELVGLLRAAQAERDRLVAETLRLESDLNKYVSRVQTLTEQGTGMPELARRALLEDGIGDPSTPVLRARLMFEHIKAARDLAHSWPAELKMGQAELAAINAIEFNASTAYRAVLADAYAVTGGGLY